MKITVLLADYAQGGQGGKLNALGLGWARTSTPLAGHAVIVLAEIAEAEVEQHHRLNLKLVDEAGEAVLDPGGEPIEAEAGLYAKDSFGLVSIAVNLSAGLPLKPGLYVWEVRLVADPDAVWKRPFAVTEGSVSSPPPGDSAAP